MGKTIPSAAVGMAMLIALTRAGAQNASPDTVHRDSSIAMQIRPATSREFAAVIERSCGDCHSNTMTPGRFTHAPLSWIMGKAAKDGRKAVNFSAWASYTAEQKRTFLLGSCTDVTRGSMPPGSYLRFQGDAKLSTQDVETICAAARRAP